MSASNINVGLGIGMSGETTVPDQIFRAQQQQDLAQGKAARKQSDEEEKQLEQIKQKILTFPKVHDFESEKVTTEMANTLLKITNAKKTNPTDFLNIAYTELAKYQNQLNTSLTRSQKLKNFTEKLQKPSQNIYVSSSTLKARDLMKTSRTTEEWMKKLQESGIESDEFFSYNPETADFEFFTPPAYDPVSYVKKSTLQHGNDLLFSDYNPKTKEVKSQFGTVRTKKEADEIFNYQVSKNQGSVNGITKPYSGEEMADTYLSDPNAMTQYIDRFKLKGKSYQEIKDHFLDNIYEPISGNKNRYSVKGGGINIDVTVTQGSDGEFRKFGPDQVGLIKLAGGEVTPFRRISLGGDPIKFKGNATSNWLSGKTGIQASPKDIKTENMYMQEMYYMPVAVNRKNDKVERLLKNNEINTYQNNSLYTVEYKPYVIVGEESSFTRMSEINFDKNYLVPLADVESNIKNTFKTDTKGRGVELEYWIKAKKDVETLIKQRNVRNK